MSFETMDSIGLSFSIWYCWEVIALGFMPSPNWTICKELYEN